MERDYLSSAAEFRNLLELMMETNKIVTERKEQTAGGKETYYGEIGTAINKALCDLREQLYLSFPELKEIKRDSIRNSISFDQIHSLFNY